MKPETETYPKTPGTLGDLLVTALNASERIDRARYFADASVWHSPMATRAATPVTAVNLTGMVVAVVLELPPEFTNPTPHFFKRCGWSSALWAIEQATIGNLRHAHWLLTGRDAPEGLDDVDVAGADFDGGDDYLGWTEFDAFADAVLRPMADDLLRRGI